MVWGQKAIANTASRAPPGCSAHASASSITGWRCHEALPPLSEGPVLACPYRAQKPFPREHRGRAGAMGSRRLLCRTLTMGKASRGRLRVAGLWEHAAPQHVGLQELLLEPGSSQPLSCGFSRAESDGSLRATRTLVFPSFSGDGATE